MNTWLTSQRAFESLFSATPAGIVALDAAAVALDCNPAWIAVTGYSRESIIGRDARDVGGPDIVAFIDEALEAAVRGASIRRDADFFRRDGTKIVVEAASVPVPDGGGHSIQFFLMLNDITFRRDAEQRLRSLFDSNPIPSGIYDRDGRIIDVNTASVVHSGYAREDVVGRAIFEFCLPDEAPIAMQAFQAALGGKMGHCTITMHSASGQWLTFNVTFVPRSESGEISGAYGVFENVTPERSAQQRIAQTSLELAQVRTHFQMLFEHNPSVVIALDTEQRITDVNPAGVRISGFPRDRLVGSPVSDFIPPSQRDRLRTFLSQALRGETLTFSVDAYAADGRVIQYEATTLPILSNAAIVGVYGLLENVTERMRAERTVAAQREEILDLEHDFRSLFERNPEGIALLSTDGVVLDVNKAVLQAGGRSREEVVGSNFRAFLQGPNLERGWTFFRRALDGESVRFEISSTRADGSDLPMDVTLFPKYAQGLVVGVYCLLQDIAERKDAHRRLEMQAQRIRDLYLLATTPEYSEAQVMTALQTGCRLLGMESGAIVDTTEEPRVDLRHDSLELFSGDDSRVLELAASFLSRRDAVASEVADEALNGGCPSWIGSRLTVGGTLHGALLFFSNTRRDQDFEEIDHDTLALMAALVGSALERRRTRTHLRTLAYYDSLTGLPNRLFFQERLRDSLLDSKGHSRSLAVLFFDLDRFKDINDTLGHAMGDRFLQMVARRLKHAVGESGVVARMGGDEFIVLAHECENAHQASALAERLLRAIEEPYRLEGYEQFITSSAGVALYPDSGRDDQALIKNADIAMYRAKDSGGNRYFVYEESLEAPLQTRLAQEKAIRRGIDRGQFVLHYQPIVDVASDRIVGVEALVRWNDPRRGLIFPDEFIPSAEASGLIVQLGEWIIRSAAAQMREWHERLGPLTLAVNISARQFHQPDLCDRLLELLQASGLRPGALELEITESMALSDVAHAIETLQQLKRIGVRMAVDDFGTGHSSLSYLRRFDIDQIKIDRSFVAGIGTQRSDETIVKAIIAMGQSLGLITVAEGVETREQYEFLRAHGCNRVQGYLFARPLEAAALEALVRERGTLAGPG